MAFNGDRAHSCDVGRFQSLSAAADVLRAVELLRRIAGRSAGGRHQVARVLLRRGSLGNRLGRYAAAAADLREALELLGRASTGDRAAALYHLGAAALLQGRFAETHDLLTRSHRLAAASGSLRVQVDALARLGRAAELYRHSLTPAQEQGDRFAAGRVLMLLGKVARKRGFLPEARRSFEESLAINSALDSRFVFSGRFALGAIPARSRSGWRKALASTSTRSLRRN